MYRLICQKAAHFLSAQMALLSSFFQMFKVLGMYNFSLDQKNTHAMEQIVCGIVIKQIWFKYNCKKQLVNFTIVLFLNTLPEKSDLRI